MTHDQHFKETFCDQLGEDLDAEICEEIQRHLDDCPNCRAQYDSIKNTVEIYQKVSHTTDVVPGEAQERLLKVLNLPPPKAGT